MSCYWGKCVFEGDVPPWELREIPGKGYAAFATRRFEKGSFILCERPTIWAHGHHPFNDLQIQHIEERVELLNEIDRKAFFEMANVFPEIRSEAAGIFMTNSFDMADSEEGEACAMYCAIARLNHSCTPNVQQSHCPDTKEEVLYASRTIELGEEINDCYIELRQKKSTRRAELRNLFRFDCECSVCQSQDTALQDSKRCRALQLEGFVLSMAEEDPCNALDIALEVVKLLSQEECLSWSVRYLSEAHLSVYLIASSLEKKKMARDHLEKAHAWNVTLQGDRTPNSRHTKQLLEDLNE